MSTRPFELIRRAGAVMTEAFAKEGPDFTLPQLSVLRALRDDGPRNQTELVAKTGIDRSTLAAMLSSMSIKGWVHRVRDADDQRAIIVEITPAARGMLRTHEAALHHAETEVLKLVDRADRPTFIRALEAIGKGFPEPTARRAPAIKLRRRPR